MLPALVVKNDFTRLQGPPDPQNSTYTTSTEPITLKKGLIARFNRLGNSVAVEFDTDFHGKSFHTD